MVDISEIVLFQNMMALKFPRIYINLISKHNALYLDECDFDFFNIDKNIKDSRDINFYGFGNEIKSYQKINNRQDFDVYGHEGVIAFGGCANGDHVCFDYRDNPTTDEPKIVVMFHDFYDENNRMAIYPVANSFEEFVDYLYKAEEE